MTKLGSEEKTFQHDGVDVMYKTREALDDRRHLVVVFVGIKPLDEYDFDGPVAANCKTGFLWIKDVFDGQNTYYIAKDMDFGLSEAVNALISAEIIRRGISRDQVTLMGFSKGASAALYYSLKYNYPNVVLTVPQIRLGTFTKNVFPKIFRHMTRDQSAAEVEELDSLLPVLLKRDRNLDRNIYLVTSQEDDQFESHIRPVLPALTNYANFNLILTASELVDRHGAVTHYNVPIILSLIYALTENIIPRFGLVENGGQAARSYGELRSLVGQE